MSKRVELIFNGDLDHGFAVALKLGLETDFSIVELMGSLPNAPSLELKYRQWKDAYRRMVRGRIQPIGVSVDGTPQNQQKRCHQCWQDFVAMFQQWLETEQFRPVSDGLLQQLDSSERIRILIRSDDPLVHRLPWHEWSLLERYRLAEVALAATYAERPVVQTGEMGDGRSSSWTEGGDTGGHRTGTMNILAVMGDSTDINTAVDLEILERSPQATVVSLPNTTRQELSRTLQQQPWQMLFFAGHSETAAATSDRSSRSDQEMNRGIIHLGENRSLTLDQLKHSLRGAIAQGLEVAIFNSCDGLGLAYDLASLQMPVMIVMREPVPDEVAQRFLDVFLQEFSQQGSSLYRAVRRAREQLQDEFEPDIPGVSSLPMIWQHPLMQPMEWPDAPPPLEPEPEPWIYHWLKTTAVIAVSSLCVSLGIVGLRYLGVLQPWELHAYDQLSRLRPRDGLDSRILIVKITEEDINPERIQSFASISDGDLEKLLDVLFAAGPRVVGLDIFRDFPVQPQHPRLAEYFSEDSRFVSICVSGDESTAEIEPAPEAHPEAIGFADIVSDGDRIHRRHLLHINEATGECKATYALSVHLAMRYLAEEGIDLTVDPKTSEWQFGNAQFRPLTLHQGGYHRADMLGEQILVRYRRAPGKRPLHPFREVTLAEMLAIVGGIITSSYRRIAPWSLTTGIMVISLWGTCWWLLSMENVWVPLVPTALAGIGTTGLVKAIHLRRTGESRIMLKKSDFEKVQSTIE